MLWKMNYFFQEMVQCVCSVSIAEVGSSNEKSATLMVFIKNNWRVPEGSGWNVIPQLFYVINQPSSGLSLFVEPILA